MGGQRSGGSDRGSLSLSSTLGGSLGGTQTAFSPFASNCPFPSARPSCSFSVGGGGGGGGSEPPLPRAASGLRAPAHRPSGGAGRAGGAGAGLGPGGPPPGWPPSVSRAASAGRLEQQIHAHAAAHAEGGRVRPRSPSPSPPKVGGGRTTTSVGVVGGGPGATTGSRTVGRQGSTSTGVDGGGGGGVGGAASPAGAAGNRPAGCEAIEEAPQRLTPHHRQAPVLQQIAERESERPSAGQGARASAAGQSPSKGVTFAPPTGKR